jgi:hypothetical protein
MEFHKPLIRYQPLDDSSHGLLHLELGLEVPSLSSSPQVLLRRSDKTFDLSAYVSNLHNEAEIDGETFPPIEGDEEDHVTMYGQTLATSPIRSKSKPAIA